MKRERKIYLTILGLLLFVSVLLCSLLINKNKAADIVEYNTSGAAAVDMIDIMSFNIQVFGVSKSSKPEVMEIIVDIISQYDIVAIQELRDKTDETINILMSMLPKYYNFILGSREGRSKSKEQYIIIYDTRVASVLQYSNYDDVSDKLERSPLIAHVELIDGTDFIIINTHITPGDVYEELVAMKDVEMVAKSMFKDTDIIILGDFNSDGSYFKEEELVEFYPEGNYIMVVGNDVDTTVSDGKNTYDRIILTKSMRKEYAGFCGVIVFEEYYNFSNLSIEPKEISDHYPVAFQLYLGVDED